jgi:hypothetical protein
LDFVLARLGLDSNSMAAQPTAINEFAILIIMADLLVRAAAGARLTLPRPIDHLPETLALLRHKLVILSWPPVWPTRCG